MRIARAPLFIGVLAAVSIAAPTVAAEGVWPDLKERTFSADIEEFVRPLPAGEYRSLKEGDVQRIERLKAEVETCVKSGAIEPCVGMILKAKSYLDNDPRVEEAIAAAERMFPVDLLVVPGDRRIDGSNDVVLNGLRRLKALADASSDLHGAEDPRTIRRRLVYDTAIWRAGGWPVQTATMIDTIERVFGRDGEITVRAKALAAVALKDVSPQSLDWAKEAHRVLGNEASPILAVELSKAGNFRESERAAFDGYAAVSALRGQAHPATIAAAAILAKAYSEKGRKELALPLARKVFDARERDPAINAAQRLEAAMALTELVPAGESEQLLRRAWVLADNALEQPQWPIAAALEREADGLSFRNARGETTSEEAARMTDEAGKRSLLEQKGRIFTNLGAGLMASKPDEAKDYFRKAIAVDSNNRMARYLLAATVIGTARDPMELREIEGEMASSDTDLRHLPDDHPERILSAMVSAAFYIRWNAGYAPDYARKAAFAAAKRLGSYENFDEEALAELSQLKAVFATQVQSNWAAQQSQR